MQDRPRERLEALGAEALSDAELLALLLRTGGRGADALAVASRLLAVHGGLSALARAGGRDLASTAGIGPAKSATLRASLELGRRLAARRLEAGRPIRGPADVFRHFHPHLRHAEQERFLVVLLDGRHRVLRQELVSQGTLTASLVHPREVFRPALRESAAALVLVHNHPSGDPTPSREDREITERLMRAGEILGIPVLDHVVVAERGYCSLRESAGREEPEPAAAEGLRGPGRTVDEAPSRGCALPGPRPGEAGMDKPSVTVEGPLEGPMLDRRKSERTELVVRVDYQTVDELFSDFARNINEGGIFVETAKPHPLGTQVDLQFTLPGSEEPVRVKGIVVHVSEGGSGEPPGLGIEFENLDGPTCQRINSLVRKLRAAAPA
jgi:DNA repair protein RadC